MTAVYADVPLPLGLDEDVPLPFSDRVEELSPEGEAAGLRTALTAALAHVNGTPAPAHRVRAWRQLAGLPAVVDEQPTPEGRRDEGTARAAAKWTDDEVARVDQAIADVAAEARRLHTDRNGLEEFTTADVWQRLGAGFPVTKGIAGRMIAAKSAGIIRNTGRTTFPTGPRSRVNHNQRLTVWAAT